MLGMAYLLFATRFIRGRASLTALIATVGIAALLFPAVASKRAAHAAEMQDATLRVGEARGANRLGSPVQWPEAPTGYWLSPVYDSLVMKLRDGQVIPQLAISWENIDDVTWRYKLRPNVKYHNGEALTSAAVVQMLSFLLTDEGKSTRAGQAINGQARIASVRAIDDLTVELKTTVPNPLLPRAIARTFIPPAEAWKEQVDDGDYNLHPIGTGPYRLVEWRPDGADYEAYEDSWRPPRIARMKLIKLPDETARRSALLSDQIDIAIGLSLDDAEVLESAGHRLFVTERPQAMTIKLFQTSRDSPFNDKRVRQAANYAIDKDAIVTHIMRGQSRAVSQCAVAGSFGYNPDLKPYPYDPAKARQLLAEAGYPNGFDTSIDFFTPGAPGTKEIYEVAAQQLTAVGMRTNLNAMPVTEWLKKWFVKDVPTLGFEGPFQNNCSTTNLDAIEPFGIQSCRKIPAFYCVEEEQKLMDAAEVEMDPAKREAMLRQLLAMNAENASTIFLVELVDVFGLHKRVQGFEYHTFRLNYDEMTLSE